MKSLRKSFLTLLALTLFGGAGAWAQTEENIFQYCYDCQRSPAYPKTTASTSLSGFANPLVGYNGSGFEVNNTSAGPWKLEYMGIWSTTNQYGIDGVSNYQSIYNCTDVPVFRLYQWNATANEYQHAAYGVVCAYAMVTNAVEHTALFVAEGGWGCVLTNSSHSSSMNITFDEDLTTGLTTLIAVATPAAQEIELTKEGANQWTLGQTPDYDLELQVEYYEAHALKDIPAGWTVMVNGNPATVTRPGDSLMITETDSVTLVPAGNPRRVKSVTLKNDFTPVESITLNKTTTTITKVSGTATETLSVTSVLPEEATNQTVTWSSDNTAVATVDASTGVVTAVASGTAHIRATANDGSGVYGECTVTVSDLSAYYSKMVECGCGNLDGICYNGANPTNSFTKQVLSAAQAIALAQAKAAETGSNCVVFYGNGSNIGQVAFAKNDGTTGSARFYYDAGDKGLSGYRGFYVNNN